MDKKAREEQLNDWANQIGELDNIIDEVSKSTSNQVRRMT